MPDYSSIAARCKDGLSKGGVSMTLRRTADGVYNPSTGSFSGSAVSDYLTVGLIQARSLYQTGAVGQRFFNGVLVQTDDQFIVLAAAGLAITPAPGDQLIIVGTVFTVMTMIPIRPGGVDLMYRILARK